MYIYIYIYIHLPIYISMVRSLSINIEKIAARRSHSVRFYRLMLQFLLAVAWLYACVCAIPP